MLKYYIGAFVAYDESILDGDAILADAIWRYGLVTQPFADLTWVW